MYLSAIVRPLRVNNSNRILHSPYTSKITSGNCNTKFISQATQYLYPNKCRLVVFQFTDIITEVRDSNEPAKKGIARMAPYEWVQRVCEFVIKFDVSTIRRHCTLDSSFSSIRISLAVICEIELLGVRHRLALNKLVIISWLMRSVLWLWWSLFGDRIKRDERSDYCVKKPKEPRE